jgi:chromate transport protein ChrA
MALGGRIVFWLYLFILVWADGTSFNWADPDLWHRLALGEYLARTGHFPMGGTFSYLADYRLIPDHEWGSAVIFYAVYRAMGDEAAFGTAMVGLKLITLAITISLIVWAGLRRQPPSVPMAAFYALVLFALLPSFLSTLRCMVFTHIFFALWLYWYQCERTGTRIPTVAYMGIMALWANLHGGFVIGLFWLALVAGVELFRKGPWPIWATRFALCTLVTLVNPFGWRLWWVTLRALASPRHGFSEWGSVPWFSAAYPGYKLLVIVALAACAYLYARRHERKIDYATLALIGAFLFLSFTSARHTSLFALAMGALLPGTLPASPRTERIRTPLRRLAYMGFCSTCLIVPFYMALYILPGDGLTLTYSPDSSPRAAIDFLKTSGTTGNLLTPFNYGSYAMWELDGKMRVSMDGRYDLVYKPATYDRVSDFYLGQPAAQTLLTDPKPAAILVPLEDKVYPQLVANPAWTQAYADSRDAVFLPR